MVRGVGLGGTSIPVIYTNFQHNTCALSTQHPCAAGGGTRGCADDLTLSFDTESTEAALPCSQNTRQAQTPELPESAGPYTRAVRSFEACTGSQRGRARYWRGVRGRAGAAGGQRTQHKGVVAPLGRLRAAASTLPTSADRLHRSWRLCWGGGGTVARGDDLIDEPKLARLLGRHEVVPLLCRCNLLHLRGRRRTGACGGGRWAGEDTSHTPLNAMQRRD